MSAAVSLPANAPAEIGFVGHVGAPLAFGRFTALRRTDGRWIVYDPARPFAQRTAWLGEASGTRDAASSACRHLSAEASLRGEPNEPERKGLKLDWSDPKTWERP